MAESAVSLVMDNLVPLLVQEARLMKGIHDKVASMKEGLEMIQAFLKDADTRAEMEEMNNVLKTWVKHVREEAFQIEDVIDEYILHFVKQPYRRKQCFHFLEKAFQFTIKLKARYVIASKIQHISNNLKEKREMAVSLHFHAIDQRESSRDAGSAPWHDPRIAAHFIGETEVVGIESHRNKLINWLVKRPSNHTVITVASIGGVGKTTLVKKVYDNEKVVAHFNCRAWITVSKSCKMEV